MEVYNYVIFFTIFACVSCSTTTIYQYNFTQYVDHFSNNSETFSMRYFTNYEMWKSQGPVYIYIGDETPADHVVLRRGLIADLANETSGAIFLLEHRYYGSSDIPRHLEEKKYGNLTIAQVLADIARFIRKVKLTDELKDSKVVAVGASYAGRLATWMRLKHPELVDAALASSAPLKNVLEFPQYYESIAGLYREFGGYRCVRALRDKIRFENFLLRNDGEEFFKKQENMCPNVDIDDETEQKMYATHVLSTITDKAVKFDFPAMKKQCEHILKIPKEPLDQNKECFSFNFNISGWDESPYDFLRCSQLGQFPTSNEVSYFPFNVPIEMYMKRCSAVYGDEYNKTRLVKALVKLTYEYGGLKPNVTRVVFVNGGLDPWRHLGVLDDLSEDAPAILIPRGVHTHDLLSDSAEDSFDLRDARRRIKELIKSWIGVKERSLPNTEWSFFNP